MDQNFLFFDVDGTLKDSEKRIVPASASRAVRQAQANGCLAFICSGRPYFLVKEDFGFTPDGIVFASGGGFELGGRVVLSRTIHQDLVQKIIAVGRECHVGVNLQCFSLGYADRLYREGVMMEAKAAGDKGFWTSDFFHLACHPLEEEYHGEPVYKIDVRYFPESDEAAFLNFLDGKVDYAEQTSMNTDFRGGEISAYDVNKGTGVLMVVTHYHGNMEKTWGFGDSMNDRDMIREVRHGVVMKTGNPDLFKYAEFVAPGPGKNGIARALAYYHLI